jgi:hypothetical protein
LRTPYTRFVEKFFIPFIGCKREDLEQKNGIKEEDLVLPENEICKLVGMLPFKHGSQKCEYVINYPHFEEYLISTDDIDEIRKLNFDYVTLKGGCSSILDNFKTMATPPVSTFSYDQLLEGVISGIDYIKLPYLGSIRKIKLDTVRINPDSNSGFISSLLSGNTRLDSFSFSFKVASDFLTNIIWYKPIQSLDI